MYRIISLLPAASLIFLSMVNFSCSKDDDPGVGKKEGIWINEVYASSGEDWIELYNDNDTEKDLSGYSIYDEGAVQKYALPAGTSIAAKSFLVLICDDTGTGLHTNFKLSSTGEKIILENSAGQIIDVMTYPILQDGESYGRYPDGSDNLGTSGFTTKGITNGDNQGAVVRNVSHAPIVPGLSDPVTVSAEVLSNSGISTVKLSYRIAGGSFVTVAMTASSNSNYSAVIPAFNTTGLVEYYIAVVNSFGITTVSPAGSPSENYFYLLNDDPLPSLRINEFLASNTSCCPDKSSGADEFDDWIEIYNAGSVAVNLAGLYVSDNKEDPFKYRIPDTDVLATTIQPGGFLIVFADEQGSQGELHSNFKLSSAGEDVGIFYKDGRTIHVYSFGLQQENVSMGVTINGGTVWQSFSNPTPGLSNN